LGEEQYYAVLKNKPSSSRNKGERIIIWGETKTKLKKEDYKSYGASRTISEIVMSLENVKYGLFVSIVEEQTDRFVHLFES